MLRKRLLRYTPALLVGLALGLAEGHAFAAIDLTNVSAKVTIERLGGTTKTLLHSVELRVRGTGISSAKITPPFTPPAPAAPLTLGKETGGDFVYSRSSFNSEAELMAAFPTGTYGLDLNNGSLELDIALTRPTVPSPEISKPDPAVVQRPGPITVEFAACAVCTGTLDSVTAKLEQEGGALPLASATLASTARSWTPSDAKAPPNPLELAEDSSFTVRVTHTAVRETSLTASGSGKFTSSVVRSDAVAFTTGFASPEGAFCIVANETTPVATLDPPGACFPLVDLGLAIVDPSGSVAIVAGGVDVDYDVQVGANGKLSGIAWADLDGDEIRETSAPLVGRIRGKADRLWQRVKFRLGNAPREQRLRVDIKDLFSIPTGILSRVQLTRGVLAGARIREKIESTLPLAYAPLGWRLDFTLTDSRHIKQASITLGNEGMTTFALRGEIHFDLATNRSFVELASWGADAGVHVWIRDLVVDDALGITYGKLRYQILGQRGAATLLP